MIVAARQTRSRAAVWLLAMGTLLSGCSQAPPPPPPPPVLNLTVKSGADQNPEQNGKPAPVAVKLIQLGATGAFERADVFALSDREAATLGPDLLGSETIIMTPGQTRMLERRLKTGAQFLGVAVLFRDIDQATWRAIAPLAANGPTKLTLTISKLSVSLK
jgi:type VI secretion system protein VasD